MAHQSDAPDRLTVTVEDIISHAIDELLEEEIEIEDEIIG